MYTLIVTDNAKDETNESYWWYENKQAGLGERFLDELTNTFETIIKHPLHYEVVFDGKRKVLVKNFPFKVLFKIIENEIIIFAVFHTSRNPKKFLR